MPIRPPTIDDRDFNDLVEELLNRIPAHTPEWTNPRLGDPGRSLIELFAWLTDTLLYRVNLIPEKQRLAFLRLLGIPLRPAKPATGLVSVFIADPARSPRPISIAALARLQGPVTFETRKELSIYPVTPAIYYKRPLDLQNEDADEASLRAVVASLPQVYGFSGEAQPYVTTPLFVNGERLIEGFNLQEQSVDGIVWLALLAPGADLVGTVRDSLGRSADGQTKLLNVGFDPAISTPNLPGTVGPRPPIPTTWELSLPQEDSDATPRYVTLTVQDGTDTTQGLTQRGILRLELPDRQFIGAPSNDVRLNLNAGVGDRPPRIDDPEIATRIITWIRLRPGAGVQSLSLSWLGINAVEIDQHQTIRGRIIGQSDGTANQEFQLPGLSVEADSLQLQVEAEGIGYQLWQQVPDLALVNDQSPLSVFALDSEAGLIRFGDGVRGLIPEPGARIRVALMRSGGGVQGNLPPGVLTTIQSDLLQADAPQPPLLVQQAIPTQGGQEAETLDAAEQRIPAFLNNRNRAVTATDYQQLANEAVEGKLGRVEVLPLFKPQQRLTNIPGVVSVMVFPRKSRISPPNPRPDRPTLETVYTFLDQRRPLGTELYVIGCEYVAIGLSVGVEIQDGYGAETVLNQVREALRQFLWPLPPGDATRQGWELGKTVREQELEVTVARVPGVRGVNGLKLFRQREDQTWQLAKPIDANLCLPTELALEPWMLPELLEVVVVSGADPPDDLDAALDMIPGGTAGPDTPSDPNIPDPSAPSGPGTPTPGMPRPGTPVPVVPEVC